MNKEQNFNQNLVKLYEYKFNTGQITKTQLFSISNFIENNEKSIVEKYINLFEAYVYLISDKLFSRLPENIDLLFWESFYNLVGVNLPSNFVPNKNYKYLPKLVIAAKRDIQDEYLQEKYREFFYFGFRRDFKNFIYDKIKTGDKTLQDNFKKNRIKIKKWFSNSFSLSFSLNLDNERQAIISESGYLLNKLMGNRENPGVIKNNRSFYSRITPYIINNQIRNLTSCEMILNEIKASAFKCPDMEKKFYINSVDILLKRMSDIYKLNDNIVIRLWERNPANELFIGSEIDTCISVTRRNFFCLLDFFLDPYMNIVKINCGGEIAGLSYIFLVENEQGKISFLFDNIELRDEFKHTTLFTDSIINFARKFAGNFNMDYFYLGLNYNDTLFPDFEIEQTFLKKIGNPENRKYYIDTFNGYTHTHGKVNVYKIYS